MVRHLIAFGLLTALTTLALPRAQSSEAACTVIRVGGADLWYPYAFRELDSNEAHGIAYDLVRWIGAKLEVPVEFGEWVPWARTETLFDHGALDVIAGVYSGTKRWAGRGFLTVPFAEDKVSVFVRKGEEFAFSAPHDLIDRRGAALLGVRWGPRFERYRGDLSLQEVQKHEQVLQMVLRNRVDYGVLPYYTGLYWSSRIENGDRLSALTTPISINPVHLVIAQRSPCARLLKQFNRLIVEARETGVLERIVAVHTLAS